MEDETKFRKGDVVRLRTGKTPMVVDKVTDRPAGCQVIRARYFSTPVEYGAMSPRKSEDFVLISRPEGQEKKAMTSKLYQVKNTGEGPAQFGTYLATNSSGQLVLEMRGEGGRVSAFAPDDVEEVRPHTVGIRISGQPVMHYEMPVGAVGKGDLLAIRIGGDLRLASVIGTDTKKPASKPPGSIYRLSSSRLVLDVPSSEKDEE